MVTASEHEEGSQRFYWWWKMVAMASEGGGLWWLPKLLAGGYGVLEFGLGLCEEEGRVASRERKKKWDEEFCCSDCMHSLQ
ncbi:uncharacterized protein G2W53_018249 [Senna tora]|uniref:Uncharacterized protein n=1 Tax=Senna tora TaxID=362788 RepID=A0A834TRH3_9FABA|nr:uncharacterized protein G2W53_018249 [Senna tora]